jgi:solute carrier family 35 protein E1
MNVTNATIHERSLSDPYRPPSPHSVVPHSAHEYERFPSLDEARANGHMHQVVSPVEITPTQAIADRSKWPARKSSQMVRENGRIPGIHTHRPRRSLSDAIRNLRERRGSVSENAHELAEALKAPVSYRLVVRLLPSHDPLRLRSDFSFRHFVSHGI